MQILLQKAGNDMFEIGDRIIITNQQDDNGKPGDVGTIIKKTQYYNHMWVIKFDLFDSGKHTCGGAIEDGYGYNVREQNMKHLDESPKEKFWRKVKYN